MRRSALKIIWIANINTVQCLHMQFSRLVEYFGRIESTSLRNEKTVILAEILKEASGEEVDKLVYLALGGLRPAFDRLEFNMAEKMILRAIGATEKEYQEIGDLGELVVKIKNNQLSNFNNQTNNNDQNIKQVYELLEKIAQDSGSGSQDRKVMGLAKLIKQVEPESAKYIVRMVAGKLRLGFSDKTIIDALSYTASGTKEFSELLDRAYQIRPDVGVLARMVKEKGIVEAVNSMTIAMGTPIVPALAQRLKTPVEMIEKMGRVYCEPKYDGTRCVGGYTGVFEKNRGYITVRELNIGDSVLSHKGNFCEVMGKTSRSRRRGERVFELQSYLGDKIRISEGHPVLVGIKDQLVWKNIEEIQDEWMYYPKPNLKRYAMVDDQILFKDKAGYSKNVLLNERVMQFLGFWVGDGFSNTSHQMERMGIVCNAKHVELIKFYEEIITNELHITEIRHDIRHGADVIYWRDPVMRQWLCDNFRGEKESGKKIPKWFFGLDKKRWDAFLLGWKQADGSDKHGDGYAIVTKERQMASMGQILSMSHGDVCGIRRIRNHAQGGKDKTYYQLIFPGTNKCFKTDANGFLIKILHKIELKKNLSSRLKLYDIQVKDDKSFCVSVGSLHNCQIHFSRKMYQRTNAQVQKSTNDSQVGLFGEVKVEPKFWVRTFTRNLDESSAMFPELERIADQIKADEVILDSEAVGYDPKTDKLVPFQLTITRKRKHGVEETASSVPLRFFVFDIMYRDGKSLIKLPLSERRKILAETIGKGEVLVVDDFIKTTDPDVLREYHKKQLAEGLEGALVKQVDGEYMPGRTGFNWVKFKEAEDSRAKLADTIDCVIMGYYLGKGKRSDFGLGAFLVGIQGSAGVHERMNGQILTLAKVGTGITDEVFKNLNARMQECKSAKMPMEYKVPKILEPDVWVEPKVIVEVAADEITVSPTHSAGYALRFPRLVKFRDDKSVEQITTQDEIVTMFSI
jgi:ATP-dependent DNA ligase